MQPLKTLLLLAGVACSASVLADGSAPKSTLMKLQGDWVLESLYLDKMPIGQQQAPSWLRVRGEKLIVLEPAGRFGEMSDIGLRIALQAEDGETLYADLKKHQNKGTDPDVPNQIGVLAGAGALVGIYRFNGQDEIELAVTYLGQGVEGEEAKRWRPPHDFAKRSDQRHLHAVLKRVPEESPDSKDEGTNENGAPESR